VTSNSGMIRDVAMSRDWRTVRIESSETIKDVIAKLDASTWQITLAVASDDKLIGTITDGDVRRGLLAGRRVSDVVTKIVHRSPLVVNADMREHDVHQLMRLNQVSQIPIIDNDGRVHGLYLLRDFIAPDPVSSKMVIMAGGKGMRLRPYTENCPKPMVTVKNKPMLEHIIVRARDYGCTQFLISVHYLGHMIEDYFKDGKKLGVNIEYIHEEAPLGTAGALSLAAGQLSEAFLVTNGDVLTDVNYYELMQFHQRNQAVGTMAVREYEFQQPYGVVETSGMEIVGFQEKPITSCYINAGIYVLDPLALSFISKGEAMDMPELFVKMYSLKHRTIAYPMHEAWVDVGRAEDLDNVRAESG